MGPAYPETEHCDSICFALGFCDCGRGARLAAERVGNQLIESARRLGVHTTPAFADDETAERIAAWLTKQADAYAATRKAGGDVEDEFRWAEVYARSLAAAIRRGDWKGGR